MFGHYNQILTIDLTTQAVAVEPVTNEALTGFYAESYSGDRVSETIYSVGFDAIVLNGQSERPTVLTITPNGVDFNDAGDLWGTDAITAEELAVARFAPNSEGYRKPGAVGIGPAGEKLVKFALIANDKWRCAGRTGAGAVMGAKRVKAIVFQGDKKRTQVDPRKKPSDYSAMKLSRYQQSYVKN